MQNFKIGAQLSIIHLKINKYKEFNSSIKQLLRNQGPIHEKSLFKLIFLNPNSIKSLLLILDHELNK